jgi:hypothetical protein
MQGAILLAGTEAFNSKQGLVEVVIFFSVHFLLRSPWTISLLLLVFQSILFFIVALLIATSDHPWTLHLYSTLVHALFSVAGILIAVLARATRSAEEQKEEKYSRKGEKKFAFFLFLVLSLTVFGVDERLEETDFSIGVYRSLAIFLASSTVLYFYVRASIPTAVLVKENVIPSATGLETIKNPYVWIDRRYWIWISTVTLFFIPHLLAPPFHSYLVTLCSVFLVLAVHTVAWVEGRENKNQILESTKRGAGKTNVLESAVLWFEEKCAN